MQCGKPAIQNQSLDHTTVHYPYKTQNILQSDNLPVSPQSSQFPATLFNKVQEHKP
jgi:hypothetical protein